MRTVAFIFDDVVIKPDRQIGTHFHSCWELSYVISGEGIRTIGNLTEPFREGEIVLIPPGMPHIWRFESAITDCDGNIANISIFFERQLIASMKQLFPEMGESLEKIESLGQAVAFCGASYTDISEILLAMRGIPAERRVPKMIELLLVISNSLEGRFVGRNSFMTRTEQRLEKVRIYCMCNYARSITLTELSQYIGMNRSSFCTFMRRQTGMTFSQYLNRIRLDYAEEKLLYTDCNVAEIAMSCGFQNVTYFNRLFRKRYGCSPKMIRAVKPEPRNEND